MVCVSSAILRHDLDAVEVPSEPRARELRFLVQQVAFGQQDQPERARDLLHRVWHAVEQLDR